MINVFWNIYERSVGPLHSWKFQKTLISPFWGKQCGTLASKLNWHFFNLSPRTLTSSVYYLISMVWNPPMSSELSQDKAEISLTMMSNPSRWAELFSPNCQQQKLSKWPILTTPDILCLITAIWQVIAACEPKIHSTDTNFCTKNVPIYFFLNGKYF